jgi:putative nucleotidyltransferase with HDIG domain
MKTILIVEDDQFFREAIRDTLKKKFNILEASNGLEAKDVLLTEVPDLILSDIQMPKMSGLELLIWLKTNHKIPVIIMTGFSMILETKSAFDLGARGFIAKPFKNADLLNTIESILSAKPKEYLVELTDKDFCKVSIEEFVSRPKIDFDLFIKLSENKFIKIAHQGQEIPLEKVRYYKEKNVKYLHVHRLDFHKVVKFNLEVAKIISARSDVDKEKKVNFLKHTGDVILEKTFIDGLDKNSISEAKAFLDLAIDEIAESPDNLDILTMLNSHSDYIYAHSLGVALYGTLIAQKIGIESSVTLFKISVAGLFHDIGKKEISRDLLEKPRHLCSMEERSLIESHAMRGYEILSAMPNIPSEVAQIVLEHHEDYEGQGYPNNRKKNDLHPVSKVIQLANIFMDHVLPPPNSPAKTAPEALDFIEKTYGQRVDAQCLEALRALTAKAPLENS